MLYALKVATVLSLLAIYNVNGQQICPTNVGNGNWVECANENSNCALPSNKRIVTVAYGNSNKDVWSFQDVINSNLDSDFSFKCNNQMFGDVSSGDKKICCYYNSGTVLFPEDEDDLLDENNWNFVGNEGSSLSISEESEPSLIRYGVDGRFTYRLVVKKFGCNNNMFGDIFPGEKKQCFSYELSDELSYLFPNKFIGCGVERGTCNIAASSPSSNPNKDIRLIGYGTFDTNQFFFRHILTETSSISCSNSVFDDSSSGDTKLCMISSQIF